MNDVKIKDLNHLLVATYTDRRNAKEGKSLLEIGCLFNDLGSSKGRIVQAGNSFKLYAIK